jgi:hypothetical protein
MYHQPSTNLYTYLLLASLNTLTQSTPNPIIQERAIIPFRAAPPPRPILPESPGSLGGVGSVRPGSGLGSGYPAAGGFSGIAAGGRGTAPESTTPFLANSNGGGNRELAGRAVEAAGQVFDLLQNVVSLFGDGDDVGDDDNDDDTAKWRASTTGPPLALKPTQTASASSSSSASSNATAANYILSQNNETYTFLSDPRLMSKNVVAEMANSSFSRLKSDQDLFTSSEYRMFLEDPICFYANIESMYLEAFSSSSTGASASTTTPAPAQSLQHRQSSADEASESSTSCFVMGPNAAICSGGPGSPEWTSSQAASISSLWATELPDQLWSAHFATPATASDEVTATATSTTSCSGLNGREGPVTKYRELKMRETSVAATTPTNESTSGAARVGGKCGFAYGLVGAVVAGVGLLVL